MDTFLRECLVLLVCGYPGEMDDKESTSETVTHSHPGHRVFKKKKKKKKISEINPSSSRVMLATKSAIDFVGKLEAKLKGGKIYVPT
jgi:hypothetical protein